MIFAPTYAVTAHEIRGISAKHNPINLDELSLQAAARCHAYLSNKIAQTNESIYGINTGFGSLCNTKIPANQLEELQYNLLRSHACGTGDTVPEEIVKLMLLLKIKSLCKGHSGVSIETIGGLAHLYNKNFIPVIYTQGSLGASGDLAPLAHLALPLIGEGQIWVNGNVTPCENLVVSQEIKPINLGPKEGLALINGTQFMAAYGVWCVTELERLYHQSNLIAAISADAFDCNNSPFEPLSHDIRPHKGQQHAARMMLNLRKDSAIANATKSHVQDPYSFRCIPQVHGASWEVIQHALSVFTVEINAVTDNPNIFPEEDQILSAGNFHGQPLAMQLDFLAIAAAELASISERRTYKLIAGERGLPAFLCANPGLQSGYMIPQYTAAGIVSQNKQLCHPASVDSIMSSNGQEDHVSMGANAATKLYKVVQNLHTVLAIELLCACQALDFKNEKTSTIIQQSHDYVRNHIPFRRADVLLHHDIKKSAEILQSLPYPTI
jgi:histidine ammonia-lyase